MSDAIQKAGADIFDQLLALGITDDLSASLLFENYKDLLPLCNDLPPRKLALRAIYLYYSRYRKAPGFQYFESEFRRQLDFAIAKHYLQDTVRPLCDSYREKIGLQNSPYRESINPQYVHDRFGPTLERERLLKELDECLRHLAGTPDDDAALATVKEHLQKLSTTSIANGRIEVMDDPDRLLAQSSHRVLYSTGITALDEMGVAPEAGTLYHLAAVSNTGKSWFLVNVAAKNLMDTVRAPKIAFLTLEMTPAKIMTRLMMALTRRPEDDLSSVMIYNFNKFFTKESPDSSCARIYKENSLGVISPLELDSLVPEAPYLMEDGCPPRPLKAEGVMNPDEIWQTLSSLGLTKEAFTERFALFSSGPGMITVRDFEEALDRYTLKTGFVPDIIIVDYADLVLSDSVAKEYRHQLTKVYEGLRALAIRRKAAVVTVTQIRRNGLEKSRQDKAVDASDLAEDFIGKFSIPDVVLILYASEVQDFFKQATIVVEKTRETDHKGEKIYIQRAFGIGQFALNSWRIRNHSSYVMALKKLFQVKESSSEAAMEGGTDSDDPYAF